MDVVTLMLPAQASMSVKAVWPMAAVASMSTAFPAASSLIRYFNISSFLLLQKPFMVSGLLLNIPTMDDNVFIRMLVIRVQNEFRNL